jgi:hypothetical protein
VWGFLQPYAVRFGSSPDFARRLPIEQYLFYPSIDPLADKNREREPDFVAGVLPYYGIDGSGTILTQISRFDRLKAAVGWCGRMARSSAILTASSCWRVAALPTIEGSQMLAEVMEAAAGDIHVLEFRAASLLEMNALQSALTILI